MPERIFGPAQSLEKGRSAGERQRERKKGSSVEPAITFWGNESYAGRKRNPKTLSGLTWVSKRRGGRWKKKQKKNLKLNAFEGVGVHGEWGLGGQVMLTEVFRKNGNRGKKIHR